MSKPENINYLLIQRISSNAQALKVEDFFSESVLNILKKITQRANVSLEFCVPALFPSIGLVTQDATIEALNQEVPAIFYSVLVAQPSTGKSQALNIFKNAIEKVENFLETEPNYSQQVNAPTIEALLDLLDKIPQLIAFVDEYLTFMSAMGRYANGGCSYDKSYYLSLWSGPTHVNRDLKGHRTKINRPRYQLSMCAHPWSIISTLMAERQAFDDGFFHRILFSCPEPALFDAKSIQDCERPDVGLAQILLYIKLLHSVQRSYKFDRQAHEIMSSIFNKFQTYIRRANRFDFFIGAMLGKSFTIFVRICMILKALSVACDCLVGIDRANDEELSTEFEQIVKSLTNQPPDEHFIIDSTIANQAIGFVHYFNINKLLLATYTIDPLDNFDNIFERICRDQSTKLQIAGPFTSIEQKKINLMRKIIMMDNSQLPTAKISNGNISAYLIEESMEILKHHGLGTISIVMSNNHVETKVFHKITHASLSQSIELGELIGNLGLPIQGVLDHFLLTEQRESGVCISHNKKRVRENTTPANVINNNDVPCLSSSVANTATTTNKQINSPSIVEATFLLESHDEIPIVQNNKAAKLTIKAKNHRLTTDDEGFQSNIENPCNNTKKGPYDFSSSDDEHNSTTSPQKKKQKARLNESRNKSTNLMESSESDEMSTDTEQYVQKKSDYKPKRKNVEPVEKNVNLVGYTVEDDSSYSPEVTQRSQYEAFLSHKKSQTNTRKAQFDPTQMATQSEIDPESTPNELSKKKRGRPLGSKNATPSNTDAPNKTSKLKTAKTPKPKKASSTNSNSSEVSKTIQKESKKSKSKSTNKPTLDDELSDKHNTQEARSSKKHSHTKALEKQNSTHEELTDDHKAQSIPASKSSLKIFKKTTLEHQKSTHQAGSDEEVVVDKSSKKHSHITASVKQTSYKQKSKSLGDSIAKTSKVKKNKEATDEELSDDCHAEDRSIQKTTKKIFLLKSNPNKSPLEDGSM